MKTLEVSAERARHGNYVSVWLLDYVNGKSAIGQPVQMQVITPEQEGVYMEPTLRLPTTAAQQLMDELWRCGLRPTEGAGSAGSLAATQRHLDDMRSIAFRFIGEADKSALEKVNA